MAATPAARDPDARAGPVSESVAARPVAELRPYIARYSGFRQAGVPSARHAGLPSPYLTLIFTLDQPLTVAARPDPGQPGGEYVTLAGGLHHAPALITHEGYQSGIQLALSPLGARAFLGIPAGELASIDVDAREVCGHVATEIQQRVQAAASWPDRFAVLDEVLSRRLRAYRRDGGADVSAEVGFAWRRLLASEGNHRRLRAGRRDRLERAAPARQICRRDRADAEDGGTGGAVLPGHAAAAAPGRGGRTA